MKKVDNYLPLSIMMVKAQKVAGNYVVLMLMNYNIVKKKQWLNKIMGTGQKLAVLIVG